MTMTTPARTSLTVRDYGAAPGSHAHDHVQVLWSLQGALEIEVEGRGLLLPAGEALLVRPGERHDFQSTRGSRCLVLDTDDHQWAHRPARPERSDAAFHLASYCALTLGDAAALPAPMLSLLLARAWSGAARPRARRPVDWSALTHWVLANLHRPLTVSDLADRAVLSDSQFRERCLEVNGCSPMHWVRGLRLQRALALRAAGVGVAEAARRTGYASPSALTAALRRTTANSG